MLAYLSFLEGREAEGGGWFARGSRILAEEGDCPEQGELLAIQVEQALDGDPQAALDSGAGAAGVRPPPRRPGSAWPSGTMYEGRALLRLGRVREGLARIDEAMLDAGSDALLPGTTGNISCHAIAACYELVDLARTATWLEATERWVATLPAAVLFRGICRVHRAQLLCHQGEWAKAEAEAARVAEEIAHLQVATAAEGHYTVGDIRRLRGDLEGAEAAYARAHGDGTRPAARAGAAAAGAGPRRRGCRRGPHRARRGRATAHWCAHAWWPPRWRSPWRPPTPRRPARRPTSSPTPPPRSRAPGWPRWPRTPAGPHCWPRATPPRPSTELRAGCAAWHELRAPFEVAGACLLLADAYDALEDPGSAARERAAAEAGLAALGATASTPGDDSGLTSREREVIALVAAGLTNRQIARSLVLSEKTVARHLSNIFTKLDLSSRTAAAAYAFAHGLAAAGWLTRPRSGAWRSASWASWRCPATARPLPPLPRPRARSRCSPTWSCTATAPVPRQQLAFLLWPDSTEAQARTNLRHLPAHAAPLPARRRRAPRGHRRGRCGGAARRRWTSERSRPQWTAPGHASVDALREAVALYRGDLLAGSYDAVGRRRARAPARSATWTRSPAWSPCSRSAASWTRPCATPSGCNAPTRWARPSRARSCACTPPAATPPGRCAPTTPPRPTWSASWASAPPPRRARPTPRCWPPADTGCRVPRPRPAMPRHRWSGRRIERELLAAAWREAAATGPRLALVTGEPGIGKTRLVEDLRARCARGGAAVAEARSYGAEGALAYAVVVAWLRSDALQAALARRRTRRRARSSRPCCRSWASAAAAAGQPEEERRHRLFDAVARTLLDSRAPLLLVADDLQWADAASLQLLHYLLRSDTAAPRCWWPRPRAARTSTPTTRSRRCCPRWRRRTASCEVELERLDAAATATLASRPPGPGAGPAGRGRAARRDRGQPAVRRGGSAGRLVGSWRRWRAQRARPGGDRGPPRAAVRRRARAGRAGGRCRAVVRDRSAQRRGRLRRPSAGPRPRRAVAPRPRRRARR